MAHAAQNTKAALTVATLLMGIAGLSGCAPKPSVDDGKPARDEIRVSASDDFCQLSRTRADTGTSTFVITNTGTRVTEFYVYGAGDRVLGTVGDISPGLQRKLTVQLPDPGNYYTSCKPGMIGDGIRSTFVVSGKPATRNTQDPFTQAAEIYKKYVTAQTTELVTATEAFVGAIKKGDVEGAEAVFATARTFYERIAPIAESLPHDLDRRINLREADLRPGEKWTGFHRLEKDLWVTKPQPDTNAVADQLIVDVKDLDSTVNDPEWLSPATVFTAGARRVLGNVATNMITGQEDLYSHTDLWDFQANLDGSRTATGSVRPIIAERHPELGRQLDAAFATAQGLLDRHHWNGGFVYYDSVTEPERQELAHAVQTLDQVVGDMQGVLTPP